MHHIFSARFFTSIGKFFMAPRLHTFSIRFSVSIIALLLGTAGIAVLAMGRDQPPGVSPSALIPWEEPVVWGREYLGEVAVPDPSNWAVYSRLTGEDCMVSLRPAEGRDLWVRSSFWDGEKLARADGLQGEDFYQGQLTNNRAFVLQTLPGKIPVNVAFTGYDAGGQMVYGRDRKVRQTGKFAPRSCQVRYDRGAHAEASQDTVQGAPP